MVNTTRQNWVITVHVIVLIFVWSANGAEGNSVFNCSRYEFFYDNPKNWMDSLIDCNTNNGTLVCMETKEEWEFINTEIQNMTDVLRGKEWYIGLNKTKGQWQWVNGRPLEWSGTKGKWPWQSGQPANDGFVVKMWKNYKKNMQYYDDVPGTKELPYICEYPDVAQRPTNGVKVTTTYTVKNTLGSTRRSMHSTSVRKTPPSTASTMLQNTTEKQSGEAQPGKEGFPVKYIAIALGTLLLILVCLIFAVCYWKKKNIDKDEGSKEASTRSPVSRSTQPNDVNEITKSNSFVAFNLVHNNLADSKTASDEPVCDSTVHDNNDDAYDSITVKKKRFSLKKNKDCLSESKRESNDDENMNEVSAGSPLDNDDNKPEAVYATVDKSSKKKRDNQEPQITYVDLAHFDNNVDAEVHRPPPYQPVEYAVIIGRKKEKSK